MREAAGYVRWRNGYEPGDEATLSGSVSVGQLGWIEDGPFFAYLRVDPAAVAVAEDANTFPYIHPTDLLLTEIVLTGTVDWATQATVVFVVPDVEAGVYDVVYCNDPCTQGLGDLIGGTVSIAVDPPAPLTAVGQAAAFSTQRGLASTQETTAPTSPTPTETTITEAPAIEPLVDSAATGAPSADDDAAAAADGTGWFTLAALAAVTTLVGFVLIKRIRSTWADDEHSPVPDRDRRTRIRRPDPTTRSHDKASRLARVEVVMKLPAARGKRCRLRSPVSLRGGTEEEYHVAGSSTVQLNAGERVIHSAEPT